ncbi:MAG: anti-sigma factor antagonist [Ardenticatenaceae bacterium]|nr:anti-sigma factor antagonist [Ardenticatenaceae bacterium]MCB9445369.1 anti-sigma factor antagonist [Ardenticatenaceae bacterium]
MDIQTKTIDDILVVNLTGEINGRNAPEVQDQLLPLVQPGCKLLLNMGGISYMSSAGLRTLLMLYRQIDAQSGCIALCNLQEMIQDMMSVTGFLDFFTSFATESEAVGALHECENQ